MPKPIIYLLLLITIGACSQKLDPKENIVCELTENTLICPKKDITKLPKFEDFPKDSSPRALTEQNPDGTFSFLLSFIDGLIEPIIYAQTKQKRDNEAEEGIDYLVKPLPLGKCTLHFLVLPPHYAGIIDIPVDYFPFNESNEDIEPTVLLYDELDMGDIRIFCREHFNLILENAKKYNDFILPNGLKYNGTDYADFPDYMTSYLRQDITKQDKLLVTNVVYDQYLRKKKFK